MALLGELYTFIRKRKHAATAEDEEKYTERKAAKTYRASTPSTPGVARGSRSTRRAQPEPAPAPAAKRVPSKSKAPRASAKGTKRSTEPSQPRTRKSKAPAASTTATRGRPSTRSNNPVNSQLRPSPSPPLPPQSARSAHHWNRPEDAFDKQNIAKIDFANIIKDLFECELDYNSYSSSSSDETAPPQWFEQANGEDEQKAKSTTPGWNPAKESVKPGKVERLDDKKNIMAQGALGDRQVAALLSVLQKETWYDEKGYLLGSHARGDYLNPRSQLRGEDAIDLDGNRILVHRESEVGNFMHWWTKQVLRDRVKAVRSMAISIIRATYWYETLQNVSEPVRRTFFPPPGLSLPNPSESHLSSAVTLLYHILWLQPSLGLDCSSAMAFARSSARYHRFLTVTDWNTLSICAHSTTFQRLASLSTGYESRWLALCDFIKPHINTIRTIGRVRIPFYRQNFGKAIPKVITDKFPKNMLFEDEWYNEERKNPYYYAVVSEQGGVCPAKEIADYEYLLRCEPERTSENREIVNAWERKKLPLFEEKADNDEDEEPCPLCLVTGCKCSMELIAPVRVEVFETSDGRGRGLRALERLERGRIIGEYTGELYSSYQRSEASKSRCYTSVTSRGHPRDDYIMQGFEKSYEITSARRGNFTRFVNHACIPNCSIQRIVWKKRRCLVYRVVHPIDVFDEITVDYQYDYWRELYKGVGAGIEKVQALCRCDAFRHNLREEDEAVFLQWANDEAKRIEYWPMLKKEVPQHPVTPRMDM